MAYVSNMMTYDCIMIAYDSGKNGWAKTVWLKVLRFNLFARLAETAFATIEPLDGFEQIGFVEVGPISIAEIKLSVGALPEQVIAQTHFASGANQQIGIGHERSGKTTRYELFGNLFGFDTSGCDFGCDALDSVGNFPT